MNKVTARLFPILLTLLMSPGCFWLLGVETEMVSDYKAPSEDATDGFLDDRLEDKRPAFDPAVVDRRPFAGWQVNASAAVLRLEVPPLKPDVDADLLTLRPSYALAYASVAWPLSQALPPELRPGPPAGGVAQAYTGDELLPSVNLVDGKAKQFDDGLCAALDLAYYQGLRGRLESHVALVQRLYRKVGPNGPAAAFLAAGLELAGVHVEARAAKEKRELLRQFEADEAASKPTGFYTWNEELKACFRFLRFFQKELNPAGMAVRRDLADALAGDATLLADYRKAVDFYTRLTNPLQCHSVADLVQGPGPTRVEALSCPVALFPPSSSREGALFDKLFPLGLPPDVNLMNELVRRVRSGEVDLSPRPNSGWYDHQAHALETLLPEKGEERDKLLLTKAYKKRMLEAFKALLTKRRETHLRPFGRTLGLAALPAIPPVENFRPRLRLEPCPSYYLRTARAYAFLVNFLEAAVGRDALQSLHGLRQGGRRELNLHAELLQQRDLFYGLYLVCAEDVGLKPAFAAGEEVDRERCYRLAAEWLPGARDDRDLAVDTRVAVPVAVDPVRKVTRLWATLGVRLARLEVSYVRPPHVRPAEGGDWQPLEERQLEKTSYLIAVDEFAEIELRGLRALSREELRAVCDREKTKGAILAALRR
jgi:hypothetical protein